MAAPKKATKKKATKKAASTKKPAKKTVKGAPTVQRGAKAQFARDLLAKNDKIGYDEANTAWKAAGNPGELGTHNLHGARYQLRHGHRPGAGPSKRKPHGTSAAARAGQQFRGRRARVNGRVQPTGNENLVQMESQLDELVTTAENIGNNTLADSLRQSRRLVSAQLVK